MKLIPADQHPALAAVPGTLALANDADPQTLAPALDSIACIELHFPKFTDGRAYSQAYLLRRRLAYTGAIRATGDVLIDQLLHMQRSGFSEALLRADQDPALAQRVLTQFADFYQGDATQALPHFARFASV